MACVPAITCFNDQKAFAEMLFSGGDAYATFFTEIEQNGPLGKFNELSEVMLKSKLKYGDDKL